MDKLKEYLRDHRSELDVDSPPGDSWKYIGGHVRSGSWGWVVRYAAAACVIVLAGAGLWLVVRDKKQPADTVRHNSLIVTRDSVIEKTPRRAEGGGDLAGRARPAERGLRGGPAERGDRTGQGEQGDLTRRGDLAGRAGRGGRAEVARRRERGEPVEEIDAIDKSYSSLIDYQLRKLRATPLYAENGSYFSFYVEQFKEMDQDEQQVRNDIKTYGLTSEFLEQLINVYQQKLNVLKNLETEINKMNNKVREKAAPSAKTEVHYLNI